MEDNRELVILKRENQRMREALKEIKEKQAEIQTILDGLDDLLVTEEPEEVIPVTEDDVKSLLKKYSRLN